MLPISSYVYASVSLPSLHFLHLVLRIERICTYAALVGHRNSIADFIITKLNLVARLFDGFPSEQIPVVIRIFGRVTVPVDHPSHVAREIVRKTDRQLGLAAPQVKKKP
jgi:hypothetical protein